MLRDDVLEMSRRYGAAMLGWLGKARTFQMPSSIESYSTPVIKALQRGVPVIAGDIPLYLDPLDGQGWEAAIRAYCDEAPDRTRQLAAMSSFHAPSWQDHFAKVDGWLARL